MCLENMRTELFDSMSHVEAGERRETMELFGESMVGWYNMLCNWYNTPLDENSVDEEDVFIPMMKDSPEMEEICAVASS